MFKLCDIFCRHAPGAAPAGTEQNETASSSSDSGTDLTLEFRDTPFTSFMRRVREMIMTDPREAQRLVLNARGAKLFEGAREKALIEKAMTKIADALHREQPHSLLSTFFRSVLDLKASAPDLRHPEIPAAHLRPAFLKPASSLDPQPAPI